MKFAIFQVYLFILGRSPSCGTSIGVILTLALTLALTLTLTGPNPNRNRNPNMCP